MAKTKKIRLPIKTTGRDKDGNAVHNLPGTVLALPEDEADALVARYGEYKGGAPEVPAAPAVVKPKGDKLLAEIAAGIGALDAENEEHFTAGSKPAVAVLEKILGYDITAEERDAAWAGMQKRD